MTITTDQPTADAEKAQATLARERANALRSLADLIEAKPDLAGSPFGEVSLTIFPEDADDAARLIRQLGGARTKEDHGSYLTVRRDFGARVVLDISAHREQVCEQVVVGTEKTIETTVSCALCGVGIYLLQGSYTGDTWYHARPDESDGLSVSAPSRQWCDLPGTSDRLATPPDIVLGPNVVDRPITEWRCTPILTNAVGLADARASLNRRP